MSTRREPDRWEKIGLATFVALVALFLWEFGLTAEELATSSLGTLHRYLPWIILVCIGAQVTYSLRRSRVRSR